MRRYKKRGCIGTVLLFPFYMIYFALTLCGSFLLGALTFLWGLIKLPFKNKQPMTGIEYESRVADYLKCKGYWGVKVTQASGDYGIDITAHKNGKKYAVQCKYYSQPVGIAAVQEAVAGKVHYGCTEAMVVTNNTFTPAAETLAKENGVILLAGVK
ncbi:MAG: restriction endonuclease [Ruminococcaceae bacterium]|nr:restriction endonuclease [Oscillospiraceae bacterium]